MNKLVEALTDVSTYCKNIFANLTKKDNTHNIADTDCGYFFNPKSINKMDFKQAIKRVFSNKKRNLIIDPLGMRDIDWFVTYRDKELKELILKQYEPSEIMSFAMPKGNFMYRPVSYLMPIDSLIYQSLVDAVIKHKHNKFSRHVYSDVINRVSAPVVIDNPVAHWLRMRENLRKQYSLGNAVYYTTDISGYFENIKIKKLMQIIDFYIGRNERALKGELEKLLCCWQYADSQGLIQTHPASSILGKVYLTPIDSELAYLGYKYSRYVDEFHIMTNTTKDIIGITLELNNCLRDLGLNLNTSKTKVLKGEEIAEELNEERDFFDAVNYHEQRGNIDMSLEIIRDKFDELINKFNCENKINFKVFRRCIHKFQREKVEDGINFSLIVLEKFPEQSIDAVKYLALFINTHKEIIRKINLILRDSSLNMFKWQQVWLLALLLEASNGSDIDFSLIWDIANNQNQDQISRSISYLILAKHLHDNELIVLKKHYYQSKSPLLKRVILFCLTKLPNTFTDDLFQLNDSDDIHVRITKEYIQNNKIDLSLYTLIP